MSSGVLILHKPEVVKENPRLNLPPEVIQELARRSSQMRRGEIKPGTLQVVSNKSP